MMPVETMQASRRQSERKLYKQAALKSCQEEEEEEKEEAQEYCIVYSWPGVNCSLGLKLREKLTHDENTRSHTPASTHTHGQGSAVSSVG